MRDYRMEKIAEGVCNYSIELQKGEKVVIFAAPQTTPLIKALTKEIYARGGHVMVYYNDPDIEKLQLMYDADEHMRFAAEMQDQYIRNADCYIRIGYNENDYEHAEVPAAQRSKMLEFMRPVTQWRVNNTKWVIMRYPTPANAQAARMSFDAYEDMVFQATGFEYSKMTAAMLVLKEYMERTDKVRITGKGTDLTFSIKDIPAIVCDGKVNLPDGEVFTAPVKDSVNGTVQYNTTSLYNGVLYENVCFTFKDGKIIEAHADQGEEHLEVILNTDEGARYIGEFAIGVNPMVAYPVGDILFDEKIHGSFHFTPGNAYEDAFNGNESAVHWDLVCIQREEYGGGQIYFDDVLIREHGRFVIPELECLNPENLV